MLLNVNTLDPLPIKEWVRSPNKNLTNASTMWKALVLSFPFIVQWLAWKVGNGYMACARIDTCIGSDRSHKLLDGIKNCLKLKCIHFLA
jgi:hypothetical protein